MSDSEGPTRENSVTSGARVYNLVHEHHPTIFQSFTQSTLGQRINSAFGSFRDRKHRPQDISVLSGVGGLRVGSKGQLDVDKSIWDVTKGVHVEEEQTSAFQHAWEALTQDVKTVVTTVRRDPLVAFIPLVLLILMLGGGLWAVFASAAKETHHKRDVAYQVVRDKGLYLETELAKAFLPAYVCSVYVRRDPSWPQVNASFAPMAMEMIRLSNAGSVLTLSLIPNGVIYTMVPLNGSTPADDPNWKAIGKDWLQDKYNQDKVLQALSTRNLTIIGPYNLVQGGIGMVAMLSINVVGQSETATFNVPTYVHGTLGTWQTPQRLQTGPNTTGTPFGPYMYDATTSTKWWGLTTVLISWDRLRENVTRLQDLEELGYDYVLSRPVLQKELIQANRLDLLNGSHELAVDWSATVRPVPLNATNNGVPPTRPGGARPLIYYDLHQRMDDPVSATITVEGASFTLYAFPSAGWTPSWKHAMVAVTSVLAVVLAALLFLMLVNRRQHMRLLHAMIPKKVISTLRRGRVFTESFEVVTVLFSDIVSYTTMSATMKPIEVVQMLDELYQEFDNLAEKHRLYKLDTIGDAFMLVGGAPDKEGAAAAAARVAQMGLDMIRTTSTKVLAGGHVVKIRVGIHSGPAVAAVVGRKAPKYTLFGDTVNTASRMESNGSPMRIHVTAATVDLLHQAGEFVIEPRGEIPIKGKGVMSTFWVTGTHACDQGPCPRSESVDISHLTGGNLAALAAAVGAGGSNSSRIPENTEGERAAVQQQQHLQRCGSPAASNGGPHSAASFTAAGPSSPFSGGSVAVLVAAAGSAAKGPPPVRHRMASARSTGNLPQQQQQQPSAGPLTWSPSVGVLEGMEGMAAAAAAAPAVDHVEVEAADHVEAEAAEGPLGAASAGGRAKAGDCSRRESGRAVGRGDVPASTPACQQQPREPCAASGSTRQPAPPEAHAAPPSASGDQGTGSGRLNQSGQASLTSLLRASARLSQQGSQPPQGPQASVAQSPSPAAAAAEEGNSNNLQN